MRAVKDSLAAPLDTKRGKSEDPRPGYGTSRRASGWEGENVARGGELIRAIPGQSQRASLEELF
jgi:hypothetical protein